jgi:hypothetical protein
MGLAADIADQKRGVRGNDATSASRTFVAKFDLTGYAAAID